MNIFPRGLQNKQGNSQTTLWIIHSDIFLWRGWSGSKNSSDFFFSISYFLTEEIHICTCLCMCNPSNVFVHTQICTEYIGSTVQQALRDLTSPAMFQFWFTTSTTTALPLPRLSSNTDKTPSKLSSNLTLGLFLHFISFTHICWIILCCEELKNILHMLRATVRLHRLLKITT